jgi:hypothetical protein
MPPVLLTHARTRNSTLRRIASSIDEMRRWLSSGLLRDINLAHVWPSDAFCRFAQFDVRVRGACE